MKIGEKVKYTKPDAYPGMKPPRAIQVGEIYTIKDMRETPIDGRKYEAECEVELHEVPDSWYGHKRFEPTVGDGKTVHRGINI